jgi:hypothetical protein
MLRQSVDKYVENKSRLGDGEDGSTAGYRPGGVPTVNLVYPDEIRTVSFACRSARLCPPKQGMLHVESQRPR